MIPDVIELEAGDLVHDDRQPDSHHYRVAGFDPATQRFLIVAVRADDLVEHRFETMQDVREHFTLVQPLDPANVANVRREPGSDGVWVDPIIGFDTDLQALIHAAWLVCVADPDLKHWDDVLGHVRPIALGLGPM